MMFNIYNLREIFVSGFNTNDKMYFALEIVKIVCFEGKDVSIFFFFLS